MSMPDPAGVCRRLSELSGAPRAHNLSADRDAWSARQRRHSRQSLRGEPTCVWVSVVSSIGYTAWLGGPPLIGLLADHITVRHAILVAIGAAAVGFIFCAAARPLRSVSPTA
jgi:MFS family permease